MRTHVTVHLPDGRRGRIVGGRMPDGDIPFLKGLIERPLPTPASPAIFGVWQQLRNTLERAGLFDAWAVVQHLRRRAGGQGARQAVAQVAARLPALGDGSARARRAPGAAAAPGDVPAAAVEVPDFRARATARRPS